MKKSFFLLAFALTAFSTTTHAQSIFDSVRSRVNDRVNQDRQTTTISYEHSTEHQGQCEAQAIRVAEERAKAACQEQYKKTCEVVDRGGVTETEREELRTLAPIERKMGFETNQKEECEPKLLKMVNEAAMSACVMAYGTAAACELSNSRITAPVHKTNDPSGFSKKYQCGAAAIAIPRLNGSGSMFVCSATATAKVKKGGSSLSDIIGL